jgi:hypothetical protein
MTDERLHTEHCPLYDSGYTDQELDAKFRSLLDGIELDYLESFVSALVIGLCDGDIRSLAKGDTVKLRTPRAEIDLRCGMVRATMKDGATFRQAFCALPGE